MSRHLPLLGFQRHFSTGNTTKWSRHSLILMATIIPLFSAAPPLPHRRDNGGLTGWRTAVTSSSRLPQRFVTSDRHIHDEKREQSTTRPSPWVGGAPQKAAPFKKKKTAHGKSKEPRRLPALYRRRRLPKRRRMTRSVRKMKPMALNKTRNLKEWTKIKIKDKTVENILSWFFSPSFFLPQWKKRTAIVPLQQWKVSFFVKCREERILRRAMRSNKEKKKLKQTNKQNLWGKRRTVGAIHLRRPGNDPRWQERLKKGFDGIWQAASPSLSESTREGARRERARHSKRRT